MPALRFHHPRNKAFNKSFVINLFKGEFIIIGKDLLSIFQKKTKFTVIFRINSESER